MKRIALTTVLCLSLAALAACSANPASRTANGAGEGGSVGLASNLLAEPPAAEPAAGSAPGATAKEPTSRAPMNSGTSVWH